MTNGIPIHKDISINTQFFSMLIHFSVCKVQTIDQCGSKQRQFSIHLPFPLSQSSFSTPLVQFNLHPVSTNIQLFTD
jgi:hypothetical protein